MNYKLKSIKKMKHSLYKLLNISLVILGVLTSVNAQNNDYDAVYKKLKANDSLLFDRSFNNCETQYLNRLIAEDFEFYHDISGQQNSKADFIKGMNSGICNPKNETKSRRQLVKGSLEVFLLKDNGKVYGALQNGVHKFFETTNGTETPGSTAKFSHLWVQENENWVLKRVISYDHKMKIPSISDTIEISSKILDSYIGQYKADQTGIVTITRAEKGLHIKAGKMDADIYATTNTVFSHPQAPLTFEFVLDSKGSVTKFLVKENGTIVEEAIKQ